MTKRFTQSFKIQAVQKALSRTDDSKLEAFALSIGVGHPPYKIGVLKNA